MLNFTRYQKTLLPCPSTYDYTEETKQQFIEDLRNSVITNQQIFAQFKKDLFKDLEIESTPDTEEFFQTAVEIGTSFFNIYTWMSTFLDSQSIQENL